MAALWERCNPTGQLKEMAARSLLLKLEQRGWAQLPLPLACGINRCHPWSSNLVGFL